MCDACNGVKPLIATSIYCPVCLHLTCCGCGLGCDCANDIQSAGQLERHESVGPLEPAVPFAKPLAKPLSTTTRKRGAAETSTPQKLTPRSSFFEPVRKKAKSSGNDMDLVNILDHLPLAAADDADVDEHKDISLAVVGSGYFGVVGTKWTDIKGNPRSKRPAKTQHLFTKAEAEKHVALMNTVLDQWVDTYGVPNKFVSGGASGADTHGHRWALRVGVPPERCIIFEPDWDGPRGRGAGIARNSDIVSKATHVVAFPSASGRGTQDTIAKARKAKLNVQVVRGWEA